MPRQKGATARQRQAEGVNTTQAATQGLQVGDPRDPNQGKRPPRVSMSQGFNLDVPGYPFDRDNFYYHWFAEHPSKGGRVEKAKAAYYEHCVWPSSGANVTVSSGDGTMYLFRLPIDWRREDVRNKREKANFARREASRVKAGEYAPTASRPEGGTSSVVDERESDNPYAA